MDRQLLHCVSEEIIVVVVIVIVVVVVIVVVIVVSDWNRCRHCRRH